MIGIALTGRRGHEKRVPVPRVHGSEAILSWPVPEVPGLEEGLRGSETSASGRPDKRTEQAHRLAELEIDPEEVETVRKPYMLPDEDCERLKRSEMTAVRMLLAHLSSARYAQEDLQDRLEVAQLRAVCDDLVGTISKAQAKQIYGTLKDFDVRLLPKATPGSTNVVMTKEEGMALVDCAREKCHNCVEDGESCRKCTLYQILEATTPMEDYGDGLLCPYSLAKWEG